MTSKKSKAAARSKQAAAPAAAADPAPAAVPALEATPTTDAVPASEPTTNGTTGAEQPAENGTENAAAADSSADQGEAEPQQQLLQVTIRLPTQRTIDMMVVPTESVGFLQQSLLDQPRMVHYSCAHLTYRGQRLAETADFASLEGIDQEGAELELVESPYGERDVRVHVMRIRDIMFAHSTRAHITGEAVDAGVSAFKAVTGDRYLDPTFDRDILTQVDKNGKKAETVFDDEGALTPGEFGAFLASTMAKQRKSIKAVQSLGISGWNPVPAWRRLRGDIMYLNAVTGPNESLHITATRSGFYINKSTDTTFDPTRKSNVSHSLAKLLSQQSPHFAKTFAKMIEQQQQLMTSPLTSAEKVPILTTMPAANWLVHMDGTTDHLYDSLRGLGAVAGGENVLETSALDSMHDWNEELQVYRMQSQMNDEEAGDGSNLHMRARQYAMAFTQFVHAATQGALGILDGSILPLVIGDNDKKDDALFMWNNIFFSFPESSVARFAKEGHQDPRAASRVHAGKDVAGIRLVESANVKGLHTMPTAVIDVKGRRIVAQCLIPGILGNPEGAKIVYGSQDDPELPLDQVDQRTVKSDAAFHELVGKIAAKLGWKEHTVKDEKTGEEHSLWGSADMKGIVGHDGRKYLFELSRAVPVDTEFIKQAAEDKLPPYPHGVTLVRPELLTMFQDHLAQKHISDLFSAERDRKLAEGAKPEEIKFDLNEAMKTVPQVSVNVDHGTSWAAGADTETEMRPVFDYLYKSVIPEYVEETAKMSSVPINGTILTQMLHARGIAMRHMGLIVKAINAKLASEGTSEEPIAAQHRVRLSVFKTVLEREMWVRAFKHVARHYLKTEEDTATTVAALFTAFLAIDALAPATNDHIEWPATVKELTPATLAAILGYEVRTRFRHTISALPTAKEALLREAALKTGVQLVARAYGPSFAVDERDIVQLVPLVKAAFYKDTLCQQHYDLAQTFLQQSKIANALATLEQSLSMFEQTYTQMHPETLLVQGTLAELYHNIFMESKDETYLQRALELQRVVAIGYERLSGLDSHDASAAYVTLAAMEFTAGRARLALKYLKHAQLINRSLFGTAVHPDAIQQWSTIARIQARLGRFDLSVRFWTLVKDYHETEFGPNESITASAYHQLSHYVFNLDPAKGLAYEETAHRIWQAKFGDEDPRTIDAAKYAADMKRHIAEQAQIAQILAVARAQGDLKVMDEIDRTEAGTKGDFPIEDLVAYINGEKALGKGKKRGKKAAGKR
ncbi:Intracellular distribution of mitochondria [Allomyces arbusculus]|nr:Intracellular distribution of mitochondria [Allomyces arbusculus]